MFVDLVHSLDHATRDHLGGVAVIYAPEVGQVTTVTGIFDAAYHFLDEGHTGAEMVAPAVFLRLDELPADPEDDNPILTIAGHDYRVRERQPDGLGGIRLLLHKVA